MLWDCPIYRAASWGILNTVRNTIHMNKWTRLLCFEFMMNNRSSLVTNEMMIFSNSRIISTNARRKAKTKKGVITLFCFCVQRIVTWHVRVTQESMNRRLHLQRMNQCLWNYEYSHMTRFHYYAWRWHFEISSMSDQYGGIIFSIVTM